MQIAEESYSNKFSFVDIENAGKTSVTVKEIKAFKEKVHSLQLDNRKDSLRILSIYWVSQTVRKAKDRPSTRNVAERVPFPQTTTCADRLCKWVKNRPDYIKS